jgi:hypothetical protein
MAEYYGVFHRAGFLIDCPAISAGAALLGQVE